MKRKKVFIFFFLLLLLPWIKIRSLDLLGDLVFSSISDDDQPQLYQLLKVEKVNPNAVWTGNHESPLIYAAYLGKSWAVRMLLGAKADPNAMNKEKYTALHMAAQGGFTDIIPMLLNSGSNACMRNKDGFMPIHLAASFGKLETVKKLVKACHGNVDIGGIDDVTPLDLASQNGWEDVVLYLLSIGANPNSSAKNSRGHPLHFAVHGSQPHIVEILLEHGADVNAPNDTGDTPFTWNGYIGNIDTAEHLIAAGANPNILTHHFRYNALHTASIRGNTALIQYFLVNQIFTGQEKSGTGALALHYASLYGYLDTIKLLVKYGESLSAQDMYGNTPLHYAISNKQGKAICLLLSLGADTSISNKENQTPISLAEMIGVSDWIQSLKQGIC